MVTVRPSTSPSSSTMVNRSSRAWVGCSPMPSPALMIGLRAYCGRQGRGADLRMAQHDHIGIALQGAHGIGQRLALGDRGVAHLVDRDHAAAQALHRRGEGGRGAGGRLVEQVGQDLALEQVEGAHACDHLVHLVGHAKDILQVVAGQTASPRGCLCRRTARPALVAKRQVGVLSRLGGMYVAIHESPYSELFERHSL